MGHRIIEINGNSVVAVPHDKIVSMLASSVGEVSRLFKSFGQLVVCRFDVEMNCLQFVDSLVCYAFRST